jgi:predicted AlkP superfamily phosphohydrolase/phosphomutase
MTRRPDSRRQRKVFITRARASAPGSVFPAAVLGLLGIALPLALGCNDPPPKRATSLVVLGIDGMDLALTRTYLGEKRLPYLEELAQTGSFIELGTSNPPQSPVAWSHFITGTSSAAHGIYDFVHRDPLLMSPYLSTSRVQASDLALSAFGWRFPLGSAEMKLLREGEPFWSRLYAAGIPATVLKIPAHFPPTEAPGGHTLSGMGTPDLLGTYGTFQFITDDPAFLRRKLTGGLMQRLQRQGGALFSVLQGPANPMRTDQSPMSVPVEIRTNALRSAALIRLDNEERVVRVGEWSGWIPVAFNPGPLGQSVPGMVRLYLKSLSPHIQLYSSPINIDPRNPAMTISSPPEWVQQLGDEVGRFYTQGMPEDTKALEGGVLSEDEFLTQADLIFDEERALLTRQLQNFRGGLLFHYFSVVDQVSHMFYESTSATPPARLTRYTKVLPVLYARIDEVVGEVRKAVGNDATVLVMSDHGFAPYRFKVNLNTWLQRQGYLTLRERPEAGALGHIDWARTQAYALGINQLFVNLRGREVSGIVSADDRATLVDRLARELESWIDDVSGGRVVYRAHRPPAGRHPERAPDLLVGFARGYRSSDQSALGIPEAQMVVSNKDRWSGDHCMDPDLVPGVLFSSRKLRPGKATLLDLAPTILSHFGIAASSASEGKPLF